MRMSATGVVLACVLFLGAGKAFGEVILDVNFSSGPAGVKTDYTPAFENDGPGQVMVLDTPSAWNPAYADPAGAGHGNVLVADGATSYMRAWYKDISVTAGRIYYMSFDATSLTGEGGQFADLGLYVKTNPFASIPVASMMLDGSSLGEWKTASGSFTPTASGLVQLFIGNLNTSAVGNAFAIDNVSVHVPEPSSLALLGVGSLIGLGVYTRRRRMIA
ncbi:MAG: PEP-CTERM sorting domain-containing protein [Pirellulaceae bacterium]